MLKKQLNGPFGCKLESIGQTECRHPYDDPEFLKSLPLDHPANPESKQGKAVRKATEDEKLEKLEKEKRREQRQRGSAPSGEPAAGGYHDSGKSRNWFQKKKDQLIGTKEEREKAKEEKRKRKEEERQRIMVRSNRLIRTDFRKLNKNTSCDERSSSSNR